jgi:hypothetical protein
MFVSDFVGLFGGCALARRYEIGLSKGLAFRCNRREAGEIIESRNYPTTEFLHFGERVNFTAHVGGHELVSLMKVQILRSKLPGWRSTEPRNLRDELLERDIILTVATAPPVPRAEAEARSGEEVETASLHAATTTRNARA